MHSEINFGRCDLIILFRLFITNDPQVKPVEMMFIKSGIVFIILVIEFYKFFPVENHIRINGFHPMRCILSCADLKSHITFDLTYMIRRQTEQASAKQTKSQQYQYRQAQFFLNHSNVLSPIHA